MAGRVELTVVAQDQASQVLKAVGASIGDLSKQSQSTAKQLQSMGTSMAGIGAGLTAGVSLPIAGFAMSAIKAAGGMEQLNIAFTTMLGSASEAKTLIADLSQFAAATPFELPDVVAAGRQLLAFGIEAGDIEPTLKQLGDVAAGVGAPIGDLAYLFGTASASGRLMTVDINQFAQRGIPIIGALAEVMGVTESQVRDMAAAGKVGADEMKQAFAVMTGEGGKFGGLMAAQSQSVQGLFSTVKDNIGQTLTVVGNQIIEAFDLKRILGEAIIYLEMFRNGVAGFAASNPALFKVGIGLATVAAAVGPVLIGVGGLVAAFGAALPAITAVGGVLAGLATPFAVAAGAAALLYYDVGGVRTGIMSMASAIGDALPTIQSMGADAFTALQWVWDGQAANIDWWGDITDGLVNLGIVSQETGDTIAENLFNAGVTIDQIQAKVTDGWLAIKDTVTIAVANFSWSDFVESLTWDNIVSTTIDWGTYITSLDWTSIITTAIDWATWIPALSWAGFITSLEWSAYIVGFAWESFVSVLDWATATGAGIDWSAFVSSLTWENVVAALDWTAYITSFTWDSFITKLEWTGSIAKLQNWGEYITSIDWAGYIASLDWKSIITTAIDWATWIVALPWNMFVTVLDWSAVVTAFAWTNYISRLDWSTVATALTWESFVTALTDWGAYVVSLPWGDYIDTLGDWGQFIAAVTWESFISNVNWPAFISSINWSSIVPSFSWSSFVPRLSWPAIPEFPGWGSILDSVKNSVMGGLGGGGASTGSAPTSESGGVVDSILNSIGLANGTTDYAGGWTIVGERGRELVNLPRGSNVYSNRDTESMLSRSGRLAPAMAGGGDSYVINNYFTVGSEIDYERAAYRIADIIRRRR